jgi:oxygen-dependent protoporphyrinogen oxidase
MTLDVETAVVGAGISGLSYAFRRGNESEIIVLEAQARAGGSVWTLREDGFEYEWGPEALQTGTADSVEVEALLKELGLEAIEASPAASRRYLIRDGKLHPLPTSPLGLLASPLLSPPQKLRALSEPWRSRGAEREGSVAEFIRERLGKGVLERLIDPFLAGTCAGNAEQLSARAALPGLVRMVEEHGSIWRGLRSQGRGRPRGEKRSIPGLMTLAGGLASLPAALARRLGDRLHLATAVERIERPGGSDWILTTTSESVRARRVVLATPPAQAARLIAPVRADLAGALASIHSESLACVSFALPRGALRHPLDGFGYLVPSREGLHHLGTLFCSTIQPNRCAPSQVLLRTMLGGANHPDTVGENDERVLQIVVQEVGELLGFEQAPSWFRVLRHHRAIPRYDRNHPARQIEIDGTQARHSPLALLGSYHRGIGVNALVAHATALARAHGEP